MATSASLLEQHKNELNLNRMTALDKLIAGDAAFVHAFWTIRLMMCVSNCTPCWAIFMNL